MTFKQGGGSNAHDVLSVEHDRQARHHENNEHKNVTVRLFVLKVVWFGHRVCQSNLPLQTSPVLVISCQTEHGKNNNVI